MEPITNMFNHGIGVSYMEFIVFEIREIAAVALCECISTMIFWRSGSRKIEDRDVYIVPLKESLWDDVPVLFRSTDIDNTYISVIVEDRLDHF